MRYRNVLALALTLLLALTAGCTAETGRTAAGSELPAQPVDEHAFLFAENDIYTYTPVPEDKIPLVVGIAGGTIYTAEFNARFMELHPECQIVTVELTGSSHYRVLSSSIAYYRPDAIFLREEHLLAGHMGELFTDFSNDPLVQQYSVASLKEVEENGRTYCLPGTSSVYAITYNKTMFEEHGWQEPVDFESFLALCAQIEEETDGEIDAWHPNAKYYSDVVSAFEAFSYAQLLSSIEDMAWIQQVRAGEATFVGHMEPFFEKAMAFTQAGLIVEEDFTASATVRNKDFLAGKIAIVNNPRNADYSNANFEIGFMPFFGEKTGDEYLVSFPVYRFCVPKNEGRSSEKEALLRAYIEFASTEEGQRLCGGVGVIPSIKDALQSTEGDSPLMRDTINKGQIFAAETFMGSGAPDLREAMRVQMLAMARGETDAAAACAAVDQYAADFRAGKIAVAAPVAVGEAAEDFTILQTTEYFCDKFREKTGADAALFMNNQVARGNLSSISKGTLYDWNMAALNPRSFGAEDHLQKVEMTGANLLECLNHPYNILYTENEGSCVFAASGLKQTVAPWNPMCEKVLSATLADGTAIDPDKTYTVAIWSGSVQEKYITKVVEDYQGTFVEFLTACVQADSPIAPAKDGRMTLVWEPKK